MALLVFSRSVWDLVLVWRSGPAGLHVDQCLCVFLPAALLKVTAALLLSQMISRLKQLSSRPEMFSTSMSSRSLDMSSATFSRTTPAL